MPKIIQKTPNIFEPSSFTGWLIIPPQLDRAEYVKKCYDTGTITVKTVDNEIQNFVQVNKGDISYLQFPPDVNTKGSSVSCVKDPIYRTSKVVCILQDEDDEPIITEENQWRIHKRNGESFVDLDLKGNSGEVQLTTNNGGNGDIVNNLKFLSKAKNAKLNILVQGDLNVDSDNAIAFSAEKFFKISVQDNDNNGAVAEIGYEAGVGFTLVDEFGNSFKTADGSITSATSNGETIIMEEDGFTFKTSREDLKSILDDTFQLFLDAIITTNTGPGSFAPSTIAKVNQLKQRLTNLFK